LFKIKKELQKLIKEHEEDTHRFNEIQSRVLFYQNVKAKIVRNIEQSRNLGSAANLETLKRNV